jgi:hypothetical protein
MTTTNIYADACDIRDINFGEAYFVVTSRERGGRMVMHPSAPMFPACWRDQKAAKAARVALGAGHTVIKQRKQQ